MAIGVTPCIQVVSGRYVPVLLVADGTANAVAFAIVGAAGAGVVPIKIVETDVNNVVPGYLTTD